LCSFPEADDTLIYSELEESMDTVLNIVVAGRSARNTSGIKNRQPIGKMFVKSDKQISDMFIKITADELNIKEIEFTDDISCFTSYSFKPQLKTVGKKFGKLVPKISEYLKTNDGTKLMNELKENGKISFNADGQNVELFEEDLLIETAQTEDYVCESYKTVTVAINTSLSPQLIEEGFVREIISKIQTMRKEAGFEVLDRIDIYCSGNEKIAGILNKNSDSIKADVLCSNIYESITDKGYSKNWNINGENVTLTVVK